MALHEDPDRAVVLLRQAVAAGDSRPKYRFPMRMRLAETLLECGNIEEAESLLREEENRLPKDPRVALGLGLCAFIRGNDAAATRYLTTARESQWARKKASAQLAILARARGDRDAAAALEKEVIALPDDPPWPDPVDREMYLVFVGSMRNTDDAVALERDKRFMEAAELYLKQITAQPTAKAYIGAGTNLALAGN
jgi:Flp pilus assembly protein TadD